MKFVFCRQQRINTFMTINRILKYTGLFLVGLLAGNTLSFILGMRLTMESLSASSYISFHQAMQRSFLAWTPLLCGFLVLILAAILINMCRQWKELEFFFVLFAFVCVFDELLMTWTGNVPMTPFFSASQVLGASDGWEAIRTQWIYLMYWRCTMLVAGFCMLLASVFVKKTESPISQDVFVAF
ncbi:MAG: DUF1772 domain-containing protein [Bacillota bacterium]